MKEKTVRCPNICFEGQIKHFPDQTKALFHMIKCPYCKGTGKVSEERAIQINLTI